MIPTAVTARSLHGSHDQNETQWHKSGESVAELTEAAGTPAVRLADRGEGAASEEQWTLFHR
jgi:hypothetical protein